jgi:tetratricopeptide (TPR) repeat protein
VALQGLGRLEAALAAYEQALVSDPGSAEALFNKGLVYQGLDQLDKALQAYAAVIAINPGSAEAWSSKGVVLHQQGRLEEALQAQLQALTLNPDSAESWSNKGLTLQELGRAEEALAAFQKALSLKPDFPEVYSHQGLLLLDLRKPQDALQACDRALALKPEYAEAWNNRGLALKALKRVEEAVESFDRAIALKPGFAEAWSNRGLALQAQGQLDAAIANYEQAIVLKPEFASANWNLALVLLLKGEWARGWALYEWGFKARKRGGGHKQMLAPDWDGQTLHGSLLVLPEQGVGDEIFYSGMLNDLKGCAEAITVAVDPRLLPLYQRSFDHVTAVSSRELANLPPHDAQVYMASLGQYFRKDANALKAVHTPYLNASKDRVQALRRQIGGEGKRICGLSWISKNQEVGEDKSLRLADLQPLLELPDMVFVDLQYGDTGAEREALRAATGIEVMRIPGIDNFHDIDGLAALMAACDVVVTVSNTTAHLAGALGRPLMVMLPEAFGLVWYWHAGRMDSPWYPQARLFRQTTPGQWGSVINEVSTALLDSLNGAQGIASQASEPTETD